MMRRDRMEAGFTLIELLVAFTLLLVGMTGIIAMFSAGLTLERRGSLEYDTAILLEELRPVVRAELRRRQEEGADSMDIDRTEIPAYPGLFYSAIAQPIPGDTLGRGFLVEIKVLARQGVEDEEYSLGMIPMVLARDYDDLVREAVSGK